MSSSEIWAEASSLLRLPNLRENCSMSELVTSRMKYFALTDSSTTIRFAISRSSCCSCSKPSTMSRT